MSYYDQPRYWFVTRRFLEANPNVQKLIWPTGFTNEKEKLGEFYHIPHTHPNAAFLGIVLADCEVKYIRGRSEPYFPIWRRESNPKLAYLQS